MAIEYFKENFIGEPCNPGKLVNSGCSAQVSYRFGQRNAEVTSLSSPAEHR
jgi:hypothetical protein